MPLDFPSPASNGQTYSSGGVVWQFDGTKWVNGMGAASVVSSFNTRTGAVSLASGDVTTALTFTPYNATNPSGYQTAAQVTTALAPYAPLASPVLTGTPTAPTVAPSAAAGTTQVATTAFVRNGTTTNDNALAGQIGEYVASSTGGGGMTSGANANVAAVTLTAGDWDVWGKCTFTVGASTAPTAYQIGVSTSSATFSGAADGGGLAMLQCPFATGNPIIANTGMARISIAASTSVFMVALIVFPSGTVTGNGTLLARRAR